LYKKYPFDPRAKHHCIIAIGFAIWIFLFLYFTEPLDIRVFTDNEKLAYLPLYSVAVAITYLLIIPLQKRLFFKSNKKWTFKNEFITLSIFLFISLIVIRILFVYVVMYDEETYNLIDFIELFFLPAMITLFPMIILSRWSFGRYFEKKIEDQKIEIKGDGNYENLRILYKNLVYIKSDDNYIEVSYLENTILKKALIRTKISSVKETFSQLLQTHRSYLINSFHFKQWNNKTGKTELLLTNDINIPVSKTYIQQVKIALDLTK